MRTQLIALLSVLIGAHVAACDDAVLTSSSTGGGGQSTSTASTTSSTSVSTTTTSTTSAVSSSSATTTVASSSSTGSAVCGDGVLEAGEACDDGPQNANTAPCKLDCTLQFCGDGFVGPMEACDDANATDDDACTNACGLPTCGDAVVQAGESCDDGNANEDDACTSLCKPPECGDGFVQTGEACDDGAANSNSAPDACRATCAVASCGDGTIDTGESCDDGNTVEGDGCHADCTPVLPACGNGVIDPGEFCGYLETPTVDGGGIAKQVRLVDFDHDGHLDAIVYNNVTSNRTVSVLLGDGAGGLTKTFSVPVTGEIDAGDVNGDGHIDVATNGGTGLRVLLGNGSAFAPAIQSPPVVGGPFQLRDMNGDGILDAVGASGSQLNVAHGVGDGTFAPMASYASSVSTPFRVAVAELNGDGTPDVVISGFSSSRAMLSLPWGGWTASPALPGQGSGVAYGMDTGDFDGDGDRDIAFLRNVGAASTGSLVVNLNNGAGVFTYANLPHPTNLSPKWLKVVDVTGDGALDVLVTNNGAAEVGFFAGDGAGSFGAYQAYVTGLDPLDGDTGDLDGDGKTDVVVGDTDGRVNILLGKGQGKFVGRPSLRIYGAVTGPSAADVNADGIMDIIAVTTVGYTVSLGHGDGTFADAVAVDHTAFISVPTCSASADLDQDGHVDLAFGYADGVAVARGFGDGTFAPATTLLDPGGYSTTTWVGAADLNGDGKADLARLGAGGGAGLWFNTGTGFGAFQPSPAAPTSNAGLLFDLDADGRLDLVSHASGNVGTMNVALGNGVGFNAYGTYPAGAIAGRMAAADFDGDGVFDVVTVGGTSNVVNVMKGGPPGALQPPISVPVGVLPVDVAAADLNQDGKPDLAVANYTSDSLGVLLGNGDGTFATQQTFSALESPQYVLAFDANGDGKLDLVTGDGDSARFSVFLALR